MENGFLMSFMNETTKYGGNYIVLYKDGYEKWLKEQKTENAVVLINPAIEQQTEAYRNLKHQNGAVLYLIEPKELSPVWYSYIGVMTVIITDNEEYYWKKYGDEYWFINHTIDDAVIL